MRATLEFSLPEELADVNLAAVASRWRLVIAHLDGELRQKLKYDELTEETAAAYRLLREMIHEELRGYGLTFDEE
mgnify:CR=1 FL=1